MLPKNLKKATDAITLEATSSKPSAVVIFIHGLGDSGMVRILWLFCPSEFRHVIEMSTLDDLCSCARGGPTRLSSFNKTSLMSSSFYQTVRCMHDLSDELTTFRCSAGAASDAESRHEDARLARHQESARTRGCGIYIAPLVPSIDRRLTPRITR